MKPASLSSTIAKRLFPNLLLHRKAEALPLTINWRRVFILPTKPGLFFGFICLLMLIASLNFNNNMGLMLTFLLVGIAQVALYRVFFNLNNLVIKQVSTQPVFTGQEAQFTLHLSSKISKFDIFVQVDKKQNCLLEIPAEETKPLIFSQTSTKRGWLEGGKIKLKTSYPFGLFYAWIWTRIDAKCLVYPKPENTPPPLPNHEFNEGNNKIVKKGDDFHGLKAYQPGDSIRLIAWKRTAQTGELISREYQQTLGDKLLLDYDQVQLPNPEDKLSRLTAWVISAYQQQLDYSLKIPGFTSGYDCSSQHHLSCLKALALFGEDYGQN